MRLVSRSDLSAAGRVSRVMPWQLRNLTRMAALSGLANAGYALARVPVLVFNSVQAAGTHGTHTLARCIGSDRGVPCGGDRRERIAGFESR